MKETTTNRIFKLLVALIMAASLIILFALAKSALDVLVPLTFWIIILTCSLLLLFFAGNVKHDMIRLPMKWNPDDGRQMSLMRRMLGCLAVVVAVMNLALCIAWHATSAAFTIASTAVIVIAFIAVICLFTWKIKRSNRRGED